MGNERSIKSIKKAPTPGEKILIYVARLYGVLALALDLIIHPRGELKYRMHNFIMNFDNQAWILALERKYWGGKKSLIQMLDIAKGKLACKYLRYVSFVCTGLKFRVGSILKSQLR